MPLQSPISSATPEPVLPTVVQEQGEVDIFAIYLLLRAHRLRVVLCAVVCFLLTAAYTLTVKPRFSATASILIPQQNPSAAGVALQAAGLDLVGGGNEIYVDILRSRTVLDRIIDQFHLKERYHRQYLAQTESALVGQTSFVSAKEGLLQVTVEDTDPKMAADLANAYVAQLDHENQQLAISSASQQRLYYEREMVKEKDALADAEVALKQSEEQSGGVIEPTMQVQASIGATEGTRAQLRAREVELGALLQGETAQNPEVIRVKSEIASLEAQLQALQSQGGPGAGTPTAKAPAQALTHVRYLREVKFHEGLFDLLSRQYETAKEREAKDVSMIEILDRATPPEHKSWPPRTTYCLAAFAAGGVLGVIWSVLQALYQTIFSNPANKAHYQALIKGDGAR